mmetsp:Transcript_62730/g.86242  ORF Transcript_62730/g.86242 Transcript_62730/m.86242 type:complete len:206 (-) Transcript_62730:1624-2241(-)
MMLRERRVTSVAEYPRTWWAVSQPPMMAPSVVLSMRSRPVRDRPLIPLTSGLRQAPASPKFVAACESPLSTGSFMVRMNSICPSSAGNTSISLSLRRDSRRSLRLERNALASTGLVPGLGHSFGACVTITQVLLPGKRACQSRSFADGKLMCSQSSSLPSDASPSSFTQGIISQKSASVSSSSTASPFRATSVNITGRAGAMASR